MLNSNDIASQRDNLLVPRIFLFSSNFFDTVTKKEDLNSLSDYATFRKHVSIETAIFEISLAQAVSKAFGYLDFTYIYESITGFSNGYRTGSMVDGAPSRSLTEEFQASILPALSTDQVKKTALDSYLKAKPSEGLAEVVSIFDLKVRTERPPYRIVTSGGNVYIVVEEGFLNFVEDVSSKKGFYSAVLKAMYSLDRINNVNRTAWYRKYVETLCSLV